MAANGKRLGFLPNWRILTYVILAFNLLMLIWVIGGAAGSSGDATDCGSLDQETCNAAEDIGTGIGVILLIVLWALGDIILGVIWLITNKKGRTCPSCGRSVKAGLTVCPGCGFNFQQAAAGLNPNTPRPY